MLNLNGWFHRMPHGIIAGFGVYFIVSQISNFLVSILFSYLGRGILQDPTPFLIIRELMTLLGVGLGAIYAGWVTEENGARQGFAIGVAIVILEGFFIFLQIANHWISTGSLAGFRPPFAGYGIFVQPISWILVLIIGWVCGGYGEQISKSIAENDVSIPDIEQ